MMLTTAMDGSTRFLVLLGDAAVRSLLLAGAAGLGLWMFRARATSVRLLTWTAVLYVALAMALLGGILPPLTIPTPSVLQNVATQDAPGANVVPQPMAGHVTAAGYTAKNPQPQELRSPARMNRNVQIRSTAPITRSRPEFFFSPVRWIRAIPWALLGFGVYAVVALTLLARFLIGIALGQRLMHAARSIDEQRVTAKLISCADAWELRWLPQIAESEAISVPLTMGVLRSTILLPADWREWDESKLDAVIAHELSHVARRDALTQRLSSLHRAIFWFSPLAWWLDRHLAVLAEQASDEAALSSGADRDDYAKTLLSFFEALQAAPGRVWWQGVAMAKRGQAEKRLERILAWRGAIAMSLKKSVLAVTIAIAIPTVYLIAAARPGGQSQTPPSASVAPAAPSPALPAAAPSASVPITPPPPATAPRASAGAGASYSPYPASAPFPAAAVSAVTPPPAAAPAALYAYARALAQQPKSGYFEDDDLRYVIVFGNTDSVTMSGSTQDVHHAQRLKKQIAGDFIWFQRDEKSYVIRDQATVERARALWAPQEELGKKQEALGKQQEELGKQQEALGSKMEKIQVKVPDMTAELDRLRAKLKALSSGATMDQIGDIQSEIGDLQSKLGELQSHAGEQQSKVGEEMSALGDKQGKLGDQQGELGRQQEELGEKASRQMKQLLDESLKNGTAQPEPEVGSPTL